MQIELQKEINLWANLQEFYIPEDEEENEEENHENEQKKENVVFTKIQSPMRKAPSEKHVQHTRPGFEGIPVIIKKRNTEVQCF